MLHSILIFVKWLICNSCCGDAAKRARGRATAATHFLWWSYLVFTSVTSMLFTTFRCETFHGDGDDESYLLADYSIDCRSTYYKATVRPYALLLLLVYPIGIPSLYAVLLFAERSKIKAKLAALDAAPDESEAAKGKLQRKRSVKGLGARIDEALHEAEELASGEDAAPKEAEATEEAHDELHYISFLFEPYHANAYWFELFVCAYKILITGLLIFFYDSCLTQIFGGVLIAFFTCKVLAHWNPYADWAENHLANVAQDQTVLILVGALMIQATHVSSETNKADARYDDALFGAILAFISAVPIFASIWFVGMIFSQDTHENKMAMLIRANTQTDLFSSLGAHAKERLTETGTLDSLMGSSSKGSSKGADDAPSDVAADSPRAVATPRGSKKDDRDAPAELPAHDIVSIAEEDFPTKSEEL